MKISSISAAHHSWSCQRSHCGGAALGGGSNLRAEGGLSHPATALCHTHTHTHTGYYCSTGQRATEAIFSLSYSINLLKACFVVKTSSFHQLVCVCVWEISTSFSTLFVPYHTLTQLLRKITRLFVGRSCKSV